MTKEETQTLLNFISTLDNRLLSNQTIEAWQIVLKNTTLGDAMKKAGEFFRSGQTRRIGVQDVVTPDERPEENAWMDRSTHAVPLKAIRLRDLAKAGLDRRHALLKMEMEGYSLTAAEFRDAYPESQS